MENKEKVVFYTILFFAVVSIIAVSYYSSTLFRSDENKEDEIKTTNEMMFQGGELSGYDPIKEAEIISTIYNKIEREGVAVCNSIEDDMLREYCITHYFSNKALKEKNASACNYIASKERRIGCLLSYYNTYEENKCNILEDKKDRYLCENILNDLYKGGG